MKRKYFKITRPGQPESLVSDDLLELITDLEADDSKIGDKYHLEIVEFSDAEMEAMGEFEGF